MERDALTDTLDDLIENCRGGERGFRNCAEQDGRNGC
jgi:hypothetical protein